MPSRTELVVLCEDDLHQAFVAAFLGAMKPKWIRKKPRYQKAGGKTQVRNRLSDEVIACAAHGGNTSLLVVVDVDHEHEDAQAQMNALVAHLKTDDRFKDEMLGLVFFALPKDRMENWVQFLLHEATDEAVEAPRLARTADCRPAAKTLANLCKQSAQVQLPLSLAWSCAQWRKLVERFKD